MVRMNWFKRLHASLAGRLGLKRELAARGRLDGRCLRTVSRSIEVCEARDLLSVAAIAVGTEARVNTQTSGDQQSSSIAVDSQGDYVVAWQSANQDGSGWGIHAQRFSYAGVPQGSEFLVNSVTTGDQVAPRVAMDTAGDFVVTWVSVGEDGSGAGVYARRYNASGAAQGAEFLVNNYTTGDQTNTRVAMDASGDFVIVWESHGQFPNAYDNYIGSSDIMARRYNSAGVAQGSEFKVNSATTSTEYDPGVGMDATGDFVVSWIERDFDNFVDPFPHVMAKQINSTGVVTQGDFEVASGYHGQQDSEVAMDPNGNYVVTWWGYQDDVLDGVSDKGIRGALYNGTGLHGLTINSYQTGSQQSARVSFGANGDFVIAWQSQGPAQDGSDSGVYVQQYNADGSFLGAETRVNTYTTSGQSNPTVAMDAQGEFVVAWTSTGQDGSGQGVYSQQFLNTQTPLLLQIEGTTLSAVGSLYNPVTSQLNVRSAQAPNWTSATIAITSGYQNGQDVLSFTNTANITGSWNAATGILTLTGTDSVSNYRSALRSITYHNTSATPNTAVTRTVSFQANANGTLSNVITRNVSVRVTSVSPTVTGLSSSLNYVNPAAPILVAGNVVITEPDNLNILSATVSFTNWQGEDRVAFLNTLALQHTFTQDLVAHTATLTITGSASAAGYQTLLRSVTYQDVAGNPNTTAVRTATIQVNDQLHSGSATTNVTVSRYLSGVAASTTYFKGTPALTIAPSLVIAPPAGLTIQNATISFTNWQGEDRVAFNNSLGLQHSFVQDLTAHTATLTISGASSAANYQTLLRTVTYQDVAGNPILTTRIATITVNDGTNSASVSENIGVVTSQPPVVSVNDSSALSYKVNSPPIAVMSQALVSDPDSDNLSSMTIQITAGFQSGKDILSFVNQLGITGSFNATNGTLTLTGNSYAGNYRTALRAVKFSTSALGSGTRTFTVIAIDTSGVAGNPVSRSMTVTT